MAATPRISVLALLAVVGVVVGLVSTSGCRSDGGAPPPSQVEDPGEPAIRVEGAASRLGRLERGVVAAGMTAPWQTANLRAEAGGRVLAVEVDNGDRVAAGDPLLRIDGSRQRLATSGASARVRTLEQDVDIARTEYERKKRLVESGSLAAAQLDAAEYQLDRAEAALVGAKADLGSARRSSKDAKVDSPIPGIVTQRLVDVGDTIGPGAPLLDVVDLSKVRIHVGLAGSEIARLDSEAPAQIVIEDLGGAPVDGRFAASAPMADPMTGLFDVEYHVDNPGGTILAGMVATVELPLHKAAERVLVPRAAITRRSGKLVVFELEPSDSGSAGERRVVRQRGVRVGTYGDREVEILSGLEVGAVVATSAQHALAEGVVVELDPLPPEVDGSLARAPSEASSP